MGNCQAAEAATVIIQHHSGRIQRVYWSVSAREIMNENPGHYVASLSVCYSDSPTPGTGVTRIRLLRPQDTLHMGRIYRLISSQEIMKELREKHGKTKLLLQMNVVEKDLRNSSAKKHPTRSKNRVQPEEQDQRRSRSSQHAPRAGQWRPSLQSISEVDYPCGIDKQRQFTHSQPALVFHAY